ncbi:MAG: hypothetical protein AAF205_08330 [Pseudomonadota bacterium]
MGPESISAGSAAAAEGIVQAGAAAKPELADIETDYQVQDDQTADWSPSLFGAIPLGGIGGTRNLTVTEGQLLDRLTLDQGFLGLKQFSDIHDQAFTEADARFATPASPPPVVAAQIAALPPGEQQKALAMWQGNDGHNDAFRHANWSAQLTRAFGEEWTVQFTTAHEARPGNPGIREAMDLYNNSIGIQIAADNPRASAAELADLVAEAVADGETVVVNQAGNLEWSNNVMIGTHGLAPSATSPGVIAVPNGDASANN